MSAHLRAPAPYRKHSVMRGRQAPMELERRLLTKCSEPVLPTPTGELIQMQLLTQRVCGGTWDSAFLTNLQAMKMLLVQEHLAANVS